MLPENSGGKEKEPVVVVGVAVSRTSRPYKLPYVRTCSLGLCARPQSALYWLSSVYCREPVGLFSSPSEYQSQVDKLNGPVRFGAAQRSGPGAAVRLRSQIQTDHSRPFAINEQSSKQDNCRKCRCKITQENF